MSPTHSYLTILSSELPNIIIKATSKCEGDTVTLSMANVRSMHIDGAALKAKGVETVVVRSKTISVTDQPLEIRPQSGKRPDTYGPLVQVLRQSICLVYDPNGPPAYRHYASLLISIWNITGKRAVVHYHSLILRIRSIKSAILFIWDCQLNKFHSHKFTVQVEAPDCQRLRA